jgi:hypothetical protein
VYGAACILGILSQPIFAAFLAAAGVGSTYRFFTESPQPVGAVCDRAWQSAARSAILLHGIPFLSLLAMWWLDMRFVRPGGGTATQSLIKEYGTALAWAVGTVPYPVAEVASCALAITAFFLGVRKTSRDSKIFFVGVVVAFPLLLLVARRSDLVYTRHFMISAVFLLLLASRLLGKWWSEGYALVCIVIIGAYFAVNFWNIREFVRNGRGNYVTALQQIVDRTIPPVVIGGDQDFMVGTEVRYYLSRALGTRQGSYVERRSWPSGGPQWVIVQAESFEPKAPPVPAFKDNTGNIYDFVQTYGAAPLSGLHWYVYKNRMAALK